MSWLAWLCVLSAQELDDKTTDLLGGRLTIRAPKGAKIEARRGGIMSAPESADEETRVVWSDGDSKLVIMCYELFQTAGKDFKEGAQGQLTFWELKATVEAFELEGLRSLLATPEKLEVHDDAAWVQGAFVAGADDAVQLVMVYVNTRMSRDADRSRKMASAILSSIRAGSRKIETKAGRRTMERVGDQCVVATVPDGYVLTQQGAGDFRVYRLRKLVPLGGKESSFGAYFGDHPTYHHKKFGKPTEREGKLLGDTVTWYDWTDGSRQFSEAMNSVPGGDGMMMHVFYSTLDKVEVDALMKIAESLQMIPAK